MKVGLFNAGSLNTGQDEFIVAVERLGPDILAINETWIGQGQDFKAPVLQGFRFVHKSRHISIKSGRGGGVGFYIRKGVNARLTPHPIMLSVEQLWLKLSVMGKTVIIGTGYRPPWQDPSIFLDAIMDSITSFSKCDHLILAGDFNIDLHNLGNKKITLLRQFLHCLKLNQVITEPTHLNNHNEFTLIDIVCTDAKVRNVSMVHTPDLGRHAMLTVEFSIKKDRPLPHTVTYRPLKNIIPHIFENDLDSINWSSLPTSCGVNNLVSSFTSSVLNLFDRHAPIKTKTFKAPPHPWITDTVKTMISIRDNYHKTYKTYKTKNSKTSYKNMKHMVSAAIESEKRAFFTLNINNSVGNPKRLWGNLKYSILPSKARSDDLPSQFNDPANINSHFLNVPGTDYVSISQLSYFEFNRYGPNTFSIQPVSETTVLKVIQTFKSNAKGIDGISLDMLLLTLPQSLSSITNIINKSITECVFPESWKVAVVKPIPKTNQPSTLNDIRPISLLPCLSKVLEKIVCMQMIKFLEDHQILPQHQSGFRRGHSTATALIDVVDNLLAAQDGGKCSILVLLDFSRAFDSINIPLLLSKLVFYGFDPRTVKWFSSYLGCRSQCVELQLPDGRSVRSSTRLVPRGVPQGSVLGPILFVLYSADIIKMVKFCQHHLYADDLQLYSSFLPSDCDGAVRKINTDLEQICQWSSSNSLILNPKKSKFMVFGTKKMLQKISHPNIIINGELVERVVEAKNLGLIMDCHLRFESHIAEAVRQSLYRLKLLYKIRPYLSEDVRVMLCESLVLSRLNYCDTVYGPCLLSRTINVIQRVQNACARYCFHVPPRTHITPFLNSSSLLKMKERRDLHLATLLFGIILHKNPPYLYSKLSWASECGRYPKRACSYLIFRTPSHKTVAFRGSFRFAASRCWNVLLPPPLRSLKTVGSFKAQLKKELLCRQKS